MAHATKHTETTVTLTLTEREARTLYAIYGNCVIGKGAREYVDSVWGALRILFDGQDDGTFGENALYLDDSTKQVIDRLCSK